MLVELIVLLVVLGLVLLTLARTIRVVPDGFPAVGSLYPPARTSLPPQAWKLPGH